MMISPRQEWSKREGECISRVGPVGDLCTFPDQVTCTTMSIFRHLGVVACLERVTYAGFP